MMCFPTGMVIWESQSARRVLLICQCFVWHFRFLFTPCINEFRPCQVRPIKKPFNPGRTILNLLTGNPTWLVSKRKNLSLDLSPSTPAAPAGAGEIRQIYDNCKNNITRCSNTKKKHFCQLVVWQICPKEHWCALSPAIWAARQMIPPQMAGQLTSHMFNKKYKFTEKQKSDTFDLAWQCWRLIRKLGIQ